MSAPKIKKSKIEIRELSGENSMRKQTADKERGERRKENWVVWIVE